MQRFDTDGNFEQSWGSKGSGLFSYPLGIEVNESGEVYVVDVFLHRVQKFEADGNYITQWGSAGTQDGEFYAPIDLALDALGNVLVAEEGNDRVQKFDSDGNFLLKWGSLGSGPGQFDGAGGIEVDGSGTVYVTDQHNNRIQIFDGVGNYLGEWGSFGSGPGEFDGVGILATDGQGDLYVTDIFNERVQRFGNGVVDVVREGGSPRSLELHASIPNPTRGGSLIEFDLPKPSSVSLSVYDARGRLVRSAYDNVTFAAGSHRWVWDGRDARGGRVSAGIYFTSIVTEQGSESRKLVVVE